MRRSTPFVVLLGFLLQANALSEIRTDESRFFGDVRNFLIKQVLVEGPPAGTDLKQCDPKGPFGDWKSEGEQCGLAGDTFLANDKLPAVLTNGVTGNPGGVSELIADRVYRHCKLYTDDNFTAALKDCRAEVCNADEKYVFLQAFEKANAEVNKILQEQCPGLLDEYKRILEKGGYFAGPDNYTDLTIRAIAHIISVTARDVGNVFDFTTRFTETSTTNAPEPTETSPTDSGAPTSPTPTPTPSPSGNSTEPPSPPPPESGAAEGFKGSTIIAGGFLTTLIMALAL